MQVERRKSRRFQIMDSGFAVISPDPVKLVPITDISLGGLGFYTDLNEDWLNKSSKLEIMVADCSFHLEKVPFKVISNTSVFPTKSTSLMDGRRYGLKFGNLRPIQQSQLKYFVRNYTKGGLTPQFMRNLNKMMYRIRANKDSGASCHGFLHGSQSPIV